MEIKEAYYAVVDRAKKIFLEKLRDYGPSWKFFRPIGLTDQIFIKARRIRKIEETKEAKIEEPIETELKGIVNYGVIALILLNNEKIINEDIPVYYDEVIDITYNLMALKNADYDDAWKVMDKRSYTDIILVRCARLKNLLSRDEVNKEKLKDQFIDIINYAVFYLVKIYFMSPVEEE